MKRARLIPMTTIVLASLTVSLQAHHSLAFYDQTTLIPIKGIVSKVEWFNPHAGITLTVTNADGKSETQRIQIAGVVVLAQRGLDRTTLKTGDTVTFEVWMPKDPKDSLGPNGRALILADGRRFDVGDNFGRVVNGIAK